MEIFYIVIIIIVIVIIPMSLILSPFAVYSRAVLKNYKMQFGTELSNVDKEKIYIIKKMKEDGLTPMDASCLLATYYNYGPNEFSIHYNAIKDGRKYDQPCKGYNDTNSIIYQQLPCLLKDAYEKMLHEAISSFMQFCLDNNIKHCKNVEIEMKYLFYFIFDISIASILEKEKSNYVRDKFIDSLKIPVEKREEMANRTIEYFEEIKNNKDIEIRNAAIGNVFAKHIGLMFDLLVITWAFNIFNNCTSAIEKTLQKNI